ncbi:hypothetical protein [Paraburkholderia humisilvae]|uniref:Uncharacterized protein n=1 Tax=Paraburkholderia humisilvae TaxID=627669 RepID=A0A6J5DIP5_9BURK|nr:hypothetical protein [Paraburkholderia humisilvae]CAB3753988.1 hypothetical protein LMG29542_02212 [Paraburkholderia humisilvae]
MNEKKMPETQELAVETLRVGDQVDLKSCPFLKGHAAAESEYAVVESIERETPNCLAVGYEGIDVVGYPVGTRLTVSPLTIASRKLPEARTLRINVRQVSKVLADFEDEGVAGIYAVILPVLSRSPSDAKRASIALDIFRARQCIGCLDDFEIEVIDEQNNVIDQDSDHVVYPGSLDGHVQRISDKPVTGSELKVPHASVRDAAQRLLNAFGGDAPSWLREEVVALESALAREVETDERSVPAQHRNAVKIESGCDEEEQLSSFQNGTLQSFGKGLAVTIQVHVQVPPELAECSEAEAQNYLREKLEAASATAGGALKFDARIGVSCERARELSRASSLSADM